MPTVSEKVELMQKHFPTCPICGSERGYTLSAFYPNVQCRSCKAEWLLFDYGVELKGISKEGWDRGMLNKKYDFQFWRTLESPRLKFKEKIYAPMVYVGGHSDHTEKATGYVILKPDNIAFKTEGVSSIEMDMEIPIKQVRGIEINTKKEITAERWFLIGAWTVYFKKKTKYFVLTYEDPLGMLQRLVLEPEGDAKTKIHELLSLVSSLAKKK